MKCILEKLIKSIISYEKRLLEYNPTAFYTIAMSPKILYEKTNIYNYAKRGEVAVFFVPKLSPMILNNKNERDL